MLSVEAQIAAGVAWAEAQAERSAVPAIALRPFQRRFVGAVESGRYDVAALSVPRGNGKSFLAGRLVERAVTPGDPLFMAGAESVLMAPSLTQARIVFKFVRRALEGNPAYRFRDSMNSVGVTHKPSGSTVRALGSNANTAFGIGADTNLCIVDEPGALQDAGGARLADAVDTSLGKPGSIMRVIYIGTIAPASAGFWPDLIDAGTDGRTFVSALRGDPEKWDRWPEIRRCNPLALMDATFRAKLLEERGKARRDDRLRARFLSYRLNCPASDPATVLLTAEDWRRVIARPVPAGVGLPMVGIDIGGNLSWSAATLAWADGRVESIALIPGVPSVASQERRDSVAAGTYQRLVDAGVLIVATGKRVPSVSLLIDAVFRRTIPFRIISDAFKAAEIRDAVRRRVLVESRPNSWETQTADISATRRAAADGDLAVEKQSRKILQVALAESKVKSDDYGSCRLVKARGRRSRDDAVSSFALAVGAAERAKSAKAKA